MASLEELRAQLFTFKMRCHEYEQRLAQVNLHGASGATLHRAHGELAERVAWLERERAASASAARLLEEEASGLREVLVKSRGAIETLTDSNVRLKVALASGEEARSALASEPNKKCIAPLCDYGLARLAPLPLAGRPAPFGPSLAELVSGSSPETPKAASP
jgi:hypothetical protein